MASVQDIQAKMQEGPFAVVTIMKKHTYWWFVEDEPAGSLDQALEAASEYACYLEDVGDGDLYYAGVVNLEIALKTAQLDARLDFDTPREKEIVETVDNCEMIGDHKI